MDEEFPQNSRTRRVVEEREIPVEGNEKQIRKTVVSDARIEKKSLGRKFSETFFGSDAKSVVSYIWWDVAIPAAKDTIVDAFSQGVERLVFGEGSYRGGRRSLNRHGSTRYDIISNSRGPIGGTRRREDPRDRDDHRSHRRNSRDIGRVVLDTRAEAEDTISQMYDILASYDMVTVADFKEMLNEPPLITDEKWGWTSLAGSRASRTRGGYEVVLPPPEELG